MSSSTIITLEILLVLGLVVGWGFWELRSLRKFREQNKKDK
jgi:hypothetical protein